jgi:hypothetical protein
VEPFLILLTKTSFAECLQRRSGIDSSVLEIPDGRPERRPGSERMSQLPESPRFGQLLFDEVAHQMLEEQFIDHTDRRRSGAAP